MAERRGHPDGLVSSRRGSPQAAGGTAPDFVHDLCREHVDWADDRTLGGTTPLGWRPLVRSLLQGMGAAMRAAPGARVALARLEACGDRVLVEVRNHESRPTPVPVLLAIERLIEEAERVSAATCPFCGLDFGPEGGVDGRLARHVGSVSSCEASAAMRSTLA